jgi:CrcB protein
MKFEFGLALLVFLGGGAGSLLRYLIMCACGAIPGQMNLAVLFANVAGCLAIGMIAPRLVPNDPVAVRVWAAVVVGFLGGLTTFSSFAWDTHKLFAEAGWQWGMFNIATHNLLGLGAAAFGFWLAKQF